MGLNVAMEATKVPCSVLLQTFWVDFPPSLFYTSAHYSAPQKTKT